MKAVRVVKVVVVPRNRTRIVVLHVEGQVVGLRAGEGGWAVDAEELFEEAGALAALDVAAAAAGVGVSVERHLVPWFSSERGWLVEYSPAEICDKKLLI